MDLTSIAIGAIVGISVGYIIASLRHASRMDDLESELFNLRTSHEALYREYSRLTDRDERGRFKGGKK